MKKIGIALIIVVILIVVVKINHKNKLMENEDLFSYSFKAIDAPQYNKSYYLKYNGTLTMSVGMEKRREVKVKKSELKKVKKLAKKIKYAKAIDNKYDNEYYEDSHYNIYTNEHISIRNKKGSMVDLKVNEKILKQNEAKELMDYMEQLFEEYYNSN